MKTMLMMIPLLLLLIPLGSMAMLVVKRAFFGHIRRPFVRKLNFWFLGL